MSTRNNKRRIYKLLHTRFNGELPWSRSAEEQAWLDISPVGREFGSPDYERLQILDLYAAGQITSVDAMRSFEIDTLQDLHQLVLAADLIIPRLDPATPLKGVSAVKVAQPVSIKGMNKATDIAAASSVHGRKK